MKLDPADQTFHPAGFIAVTIAYALVIWLESALNIPTRNTLGDFAVRWVVVFAIALPLAMLLRKFVFGG